MALADNRKRARSDGEKEARRAEILAAARGLIADVGLDEVTMSALAARAGLAKGTLYLYVRTKEELFLLLFEAAMVAFADGIEALHTPDALADELTRLAIEVPLFLALFARLVAVIEVNVDDAALFAAKRAVAARGDRITAHIQGLLALSSDQAAAVVNALMMAMQGAAQFDITARRDPATLPEDLRPIFAAHAFELSYPPTARLILSALG